MKKLLSVILLIVAILTISVFAEEVKPVTVTLNGETVDCASYGQEATIVEGRTLVPLRAIFEALGATVEWNGETKTVSSTLGETTVKLVIGENTLYRNDQEITLDVPAQIMNGRTLVPARAVAEAFGVSVAWDSTSRAVILGSGASAYNAYLENILDEIQPKAALDKEILCYAGGIPVSAAAVKSAVMMALNEGQDLSANSTMEAIEDLFKQNAMLVQFAYKDNIMLSEVDVNQIKADVMGLKLQLGENYESAFARTPYTKYFYHLNYSLYGVVFSKLVDIYANGTNPAIYDQAVAYLEENEYVRAKHILVQFPGLSEGRAITEEDRSAAFSKILNILVEVNAMKDISEFDALIEKYNEDPGMKSNPDGYYFTRNQMVKPFEDVTYALSEGKTSSIVETDYGYHIILRLPLVDENLVNTAEYAAAVQMVISNTLYDLAEDLEMVYNDNFESRVNDFAKEYNEKFAS